jgi:hypothetical protein
MIARMGDRTFRGNCRAGGLLRRSCQLELSAIMGGPDASTQAANIAPGDSLRTSPVSLIGSHLSMPGSSASPSAGYRAGTALRATRKPKL